MKVESFKPPFIFLNIVQLFPAASYVSIQTPLVTSCQKCDKYLIRDVWRLLGESIFCILKFMQNVYSDCTQCF